MAGVFESSLRETYARTSCTPRPAWGPELAPVLFLDPLLSPAVALTRILSLKASGPMTKRLPTSSKTSSAPPAPLISSSMLHDLRTSVYCVMSLVTMSPPGPLITNRLKCSRRRLRVPRATSPSNCRTLEPIDGSDVTAMFCRRVKKAHIEEHV